MGALASLKHDTMLGKTGSGIFSKPFPSHLRPTLPDPLRLTGRLQSSFSDPFSGPNSAAGTRDPLGLRQPLHFGRGSAAANNKRFQEARNGNAIAITFSLHRNSGGALGCSLWCFCRDARTSAAAHDVVAWPCPIACCGATTQHPERRALVAGRVLL